MSFHTLTEENASSRGISAVGADEKESRMLVDRRRRPARTDVRIVALSVGATAMLVGAALTSWILR